MNPIQVIAVTGGKGGIGKTNVSVNLGVALARKGRRVTLLDADFGLANVDVLLGLKPARTLKEVIDGVCGLSEVQLDGPEGMKIVPAASGLQEMASLSAEQQAAVIRAFSDIAHGMDVLLIDTAAGISSDVVRFLCAAQEVLVVTCDEPTAITDAYALIKVLNQNHGMSRVRLLANMVRGEAEGLRLYDKLQTVCERFLDITLLYAGCVPQDDAVRRSVQKQQPVVELYPASPAAKAFGRLADTVDSWPIPARPSGHLSFFVDRMLDAQPGAPNVAALQPGTATAG
ncbi:MAG: MinD/ParA family protein [Pseudomonadota bacterium]